MKNKVNSDVVRGNLELERVLRELASNSGVFSTGNLYVVMPTAHSNYVDFENEYNVKYSDGTERVQTSLTAAITAASANDLIIVAEGYTQTITGVGGLALDKAGLTIVGLGRGTSRPTILMDGGATVTAAVTAANVHLENLVFNAGHADVATCFELTTAKNFHLVNVEFGENVATENFLVVVRTSTVNNASDGLSLKNCTYIGVDTATTNLLQLRGDIDKLVMEDCYVSMGVNDNDAIIECATGKDITNVSIQRNRIHRLNTEGDLIVDNDTADNSGIAADNFILHADTVGEVYIDADGVGLFDNKGTAVVTASGYLLPAVDS